MKKIKERNAAHLLLTKFVEREVDDIASALEPIIPMYFDITYDGLEKSMSVVNQTFASVGRKARLMELDPHYCDVIIARWEKLTGQKAVKL